MFKEISVKKTGRLAILVLALGVAACQPELPAYYAAPAPPPLQPYLGPPLATAHGVTRRRVARHHYVRKHRPRRVHGQCLPAQTPTP